MHVYKLAQTSVAFIKQHNTFKAEFDGFQFLVHTGTLVAIPIDESCCTLLVLCYVFSQFSSNLATRHIVYVCAVSTAGGI